MSKDFALDLGAIAHGVDGDDVVFTIGNQEVTYDELHAAVIGAALGLVLGERGVALKTLLAEPHYFLASLAVLYISGKRLASAPSD